MWPPSQRRPARLAKGQMLQDPFFVGTTAPGRPPLTHTLQ